MGARRRHLSRIPAIRQCSEETAKSLEPPTNKGAMGSIASGGYRGLHGRGHLDEDLHGGILHHRRHGDNPNNPPHLMSQPLVLNTNERKPAESDLLRNDSDGVDVFAFLIILRIDNRRVTIRTGGVHRRTLSRVLFSLLAFRRTGDALRKLQRFLRFKVASEVCSIKSSDGT